MARVGVKAPGRRAAPAGAAQPDRRRRRSAEDRRAQVVATARKLMVRHGVEGVSMRAIAAAAGVSPAALYLYFPDKLLLMAAVVDALFEGLLATLTEAAAAAAARRDPFARLAALMDAYVAWGLAHPEEYRLMFMTPVVGVAGHRPRGPDGRPGAPNGAATFGTLVAEVSALIAAGHVKRAEPAALAEQIWAGGHGVVSLLTTFPAFEWCGREALLRGMRETMLRGIAA